MTSELIVPTLIVLRGMTTRARNAARRRFGPHRDEAGVSTLEMVIIALGLIAIATMLVVAITAAVTRRTDQIN